VKTARQGSRTRIRLIRIGTRSRSR